MKNLEKENDFLKIIQENKIVLFQFGSNSCAPCKSLKSKISDYENTNEIFVAVYVPVEKFFSLAARLTIFTVPTILVYVDGKPTIRKSGYFSLEEIFLKIEKYYLFLNSVDIK